MPAEDRSQQPPQARRKLVYLTASQLISDTANAVHVMKMAEAFARSNLDVTLVAAEGEGRPQEVPGYYGVAAGIFKIVRLSGRETIVTRVLAGLWRRFPGLRLNAPISLIQGLGAVRRVIAERRADAVHARNLWWAIAAIPAKVPFAIEIHMMPKRGPAEWPHRLLLRRRNLACVVFISGRLCDLYLGRFPQLSRSRTLVAHDGANVPAPQPAQPDNSDARPAVGYVGHLYKGRGIEVLLRIAAALPHADVHVVGGTEQALAFWRSRSDAPNLTFHGHVPHAEVERLLPRFDVLLAPYQRIVQVAGGGGDTSDYMSPLKIFEYMAAGKALVASDLPVLREVLRSGENAILVDPEDHDAWIAAVDGLLQTPDRRRRLGARARADLEALYTWNARADAIAGRLLRIPGAHQAAASSV